MNLRRAMTEASGPHCELKKRYARVLEGADQSFWDWNLKTGEFRVSVRFETMLGYAPGELPGREDEAILIPPAEWRAYVHPEDLVKARESIERHLQGMTPAHEIELRCKTKMGEWKWLLTKGRVVERDESGAPLIMSGTHTDITDRKKAEQELRRSEERFRIALMNSQATVFEQNLELRYTYNHRPFFGYSPEQVFGKRDRDLLDPASAAELEAIKQSVLDTEAPLRKEVSVTAPDGRTEHYDLYAEPRRDWSGNIVGIICTAVDITARRQAEEKTKKLSVQLKLALLATRLGWWHYDPINKTATYDERYCEIFHVAGNMLPIEETLKLLHPDDVQGVWANVEAALDPTAPKPYEAEYRILLPDGSVRWVKAYGMAIFEGEGQARHAVSLIGTVNDITEQRQAEEDMARLSAQRQLALDAASLGWWRHDLLTGTISHDRRFEEIFDLSGEYPHTREEFMARVYPDDLPGLLEKIRESMDPANPSRYESEHRIILREGSVRWIRAFGKVLFEGEGLARRPVSVVGTVEDMTDLKEAEEERARLSAQRQLALDAARMGSWQYDVKRDVITHDERYGQICEFSGGTLSREDTLARTHPDDRARVLEAIHATMDPNASEPYDLDIRLVLYDGSVRWIRAHGMATFEGEGSARHATGMTGTVTDITTSKEAEEAVRLAAKVYEDSSEAMMVLDEEHRIIMVNQAFTAITGYAADEVTGKHPRFLRASPQDDAFYAEMWEQVYRAGRFKGEVWHKKKDGQFFAVQIITNAITDGAYLPKKYVVLLSDITEKKRSDDMLWSQANFDTLTGVPNRRFFRDRLEHEVRNARRSKLPLALLFIDLDGFKDVNDTLGHDMGDLLLKEAADRLCRCVRETDTVARLGGDEFTVILPELHDPGNVDRVARHILRTLSEPIRLGEELAYVSGSIGITLFPSDAADVEELIRNADQAMYAAKQSGKNQYHYFTPAMQEEAQRKMRVINELRGALDARQFEIVYQPIVELSSGTIQKAEALIRWQHPRKGLINPLEFISAAEDTGMISSFGNWVFHEAAKQSALWREKHHPEFQISVNISPVQFRKEGIAPSVWFDHLKALGLPGQGIVVEITEGLLLDASPKVMDQLLMLRDAGIEVALDDFGTGYSSLAYIKKFDIDYIKIDQTFIANLSAGTNDMALCGAIIVMAHQLGLKVIAEGVETSSQHELLANAGCDFAQGFLFSRPLHASDFERMLSANPFASQEILDF